MSDVLLDVQGVHAGYGPAKVLTGIDLQVRSGEIVAVLGSNGAGKSTLARTLCGLVPATAGAIRFAGHDITRSSPQEIARLGLAYLPEGRGVFPGLSVSDNLRMWAMPLPRRERRSYGDRVLDIFRSCGNAVGNRPGSHSGGEQQMLSLARAFVASPTLVVADELSLGLAPKMVESVFEALARIAAEGITVVMIEQFVHRALALATSCVVVRRGRIAWQGPAEGADEHVLSHYLGGAGVAEAATPS
jgi:branched-chain amino acid transport system ATP-binding protein